MDLDFPPSGVICALCFKLVANEAEMTISEKCWTVWFYAMFFLVWRSVLIKLFCEIYKWIGLISKFCSFLKISQSPSHFQIFIVNKEQGTRHSQVSFRTLSQKKKMDIFNFDIFWRVTIVLLESSLWHTSWLLHQQTNLIFSLVVTS